MSKRHVSIRNAAYRTIEEQGPMTAIEITERTLNHRGKPYHEMPSPTTLSQILMKDGRFKIVGRATIRYLLGAKGKNIVWGIKDEK